MLKAIITHLHKITFGNTGAQPHDQWSKHFNLKMEKGFCEFQYNLRSCTINAEKNKPTTNVCKIGAQLHDGWPYMSNLKIQSFVGLIAI